jgi:cytochrome P450
MSNTAKLSPAAEKPDHVPESLVYDFDFYADPGLIARGHDRAIEVAKEAPEIFWTPRQGGHWMIKGHKAVFAASRDTDSFSNSPFSYDEMQEIIKSLPADYPKPLIPTPITLDAPHHGTFRMPLQRAFSPKAMKAISDDIRTLAISLIEEFKPLGGCEFMAAIAEPLPVTVFLKMFGLPIERQAEYRVLVKQHLAATDSNPSAVQERLRKVAAAMHDTIMERKDNPQDDIISMLWAAEFNGEPATINDMENYCVMIFVAGLDTVMNGMGLGALHLANNPQLQAELKADPSKVPSATEEILRRYTFTLPPRFVAKDMAFQGVTMKKGEKAVLLLPTADLDESEYDSPEEFKLARENVHIAFGAGPHRCLGSHLARVELNILYEEMVKRLPEFKLDPSKAVQYHGGPVWGPESLHLVW